MNDFTMSVHQNEYLPDGTAEVHAIVTVTGSPASVATDTPSAIVIMGDRSGSMDHPFDPDSPRSLPKIKAARTALAAAISQIPDGTEFAVIGGNQHGEVLYPRPGRMAIASDHSRQEAARTIQQIAPRGGTAMSTWLAAARDLLSRSTSPIRLGILVTDGKNESESANLLAAEVVACEGVFQCDCRGVGIDWDVAELRNIATRLLGDVDMIRDPDQMEADFADLIARAAGKVVASSALRLWTPKGAEVVYVKQVSPVVEDITSRATAISDQIREFPVGAWGDEERDYHVCVRVAPGLVGDEMLAARVNLMVGDETCGQAMIRAVWTDDVALSTRIVPEVAHYSGQAELANAIQDGLAARGSGDTHTATVKLGDAVRLATEGGNSGTLKLLEKVVEIEDAVTGTVRLRKAVAKGDEMELDTRSTKTVRVPRQP